MVLFIGCVMSLLVLNDVLIKGLLRYGRMFVMRYPNNREIASLAAALFVAATFHGFNAQYWRIMRWVFNDLS